MFNILYDYQNHLKWNYAIDKRQLQILIIFPSTNSNWYLKSLCKFFRCLLNVSALGFFFLLQPSCMLIKNLHYVWRNQVLGFTSHIFLELHNNFRKPYIHSSLFIIGLYTEVLHCFGGTADRCRVSIYPYRWQAQGVRGSGLALTAMYTPLSH